MKSVNRDIDWIITPELSDCRGLPAFGVLLQNQGKCFSAIAAYAGMHRALSMG
ncbi:MAG: hypothetical protein JEZ11_20785 [Desulfobacterales bacterium]|nr:hypothetical protein [Desulfobacterales bacterium]